MQLAWQLLPRIESVQLVRTTFAYSPHVVANVSNCLIYNRAVFSLKFFGTHSAQQWFFLTLVAFRKQSSRTSITRPEKTRIILSESCFSICRQFITMTNLIMHIVPKFTFTTTARSQTWQPSSRQCRCWEANLSLRSFARGWKSRDTNWASW